MFEILGEVLGPIALVLVAIGAAALLYLVVTTIKARREERRDQTQGGAHRR